MTTRQQLNGLYFVKGYFKEMLKTKEDAEIREALNSVLHAIACIEKHGLPF